MQATNKKGAPTQQAANAFKKKAADSRTAPYTFQDFKRPTKQQKDEAGSEGSAFMAINSTRYPQRPLPINSADDTEVEILRELKHGDLISPARPYPIKDWEINYYKEKAAAEEFAAYQQWLGDKYDLNDMATRAWFKQIAPEYFSQKRELLKELMDRHARYSLLRMAGPENEDDLMFEYMVESGRIEIPTGPFYDPIDWAYNEVNNKGLSASRADLMKENGVDAFMGDVIKHNQRAYQYGLFSPMRPASLKQAGWVGNPLNQSDIVGNAAASPFGFLGQKIPTSNRWDVDYLGDNLTGKRSDQTIANNDTYIAANSFNGGSSANYNKSGKNNNVPYPFKGMLNWGAPPSIE